MYISVNGGQLRIALVNPPHPYLIEPNQQAPIGLAYLNAMLKLKRPEDKTGVSSDIINLSHMSIEEAAEWIGQYDMYGYTATVTDYLNVEALARLIKGRYPESKHVIGGPMLLSPLN